MHNHTLLGPPGIERLIAFETFVAIQRLGFPRLHQRRIHVQRGSWLGTVALHKR